MRTHTHSLLHAFRKIKRRISKIFRYYVMFVLGAALCTMLLNCCSPTNAFAQQYNFEHGLVTSGVTEFSCALSRLEERGTVWSHREQLAIKTLAKPVSFQEVQDHSEKGHQVMLKDFELVEDERLDSLKLIVSRLQVIVQQRFPSYHFKAFVIKPRSGKKVTNSFCTGTYLYVTTDLIELAQDWETVSFAVAHEMAHLINEHIHNHIRRFRLTQKFVGKAWGSLGAELYQILLPGFNISQEIQCDYAAVWLMDKAHYDPELAIGFLERWHANDRDQPLLKYFRTHPQGKERIACLRGYVNGARSSALSQH